MVKDKDTYKNEDGLSIKCPYNKIISKMVSLMAKKIDKEVMKKMTAFVKVAKYGL